MYWRDLKLPQHGMLTSWLVQLGTDNVKLFNAAHEITCGVVDLLTNTLFSAQTNHSWQSPCTWSLNSQQIQNVTLYNTAGWLIFTIYLYRQKMLNSISIIFKFHRFKPSQRRLSLIQMLLTWDEDEWRQMLQTYLSTAVDWWWWWSACPGGANGSVAVRAAWLRWQTSQGRGPGWPDASRLNSRAGTEGSTVYTLNCDRWRSVISPCLNHW